MKIVVNSGKLVNERDIDDVKFDYDPTANLECGLHELTYKQLFLETIKFINDNNTINKPYLKYPKIYLNRNISKCDDIQQCKQCYKNGNNDSDIGSANALNFDLCVTKRRHLTDKLYNMAQQQQCLTQSLINTTAALFMNDKTLINHSNQFTLAENWFAKVYSFLVWHQEVINVLLHNLAQLNNDEMEQDVFLKKFDFLTISHSYINQLIDYLVFYYCCFDSQKWIGIFYPFIQAGIGTFECKMLFAQSIINTQVKSLCHQSFQLNDATNINELKQEMENKEDILKEMKAIAMFKRLLIETYDHETTNKHKNVDDLALWPGGDPFDWMDKICIHLNNCTNNVKTQVLLVKMNEIESSDEMNEDDSDMADWDQYPQRDYWTIDEDKYNIYNFAVASFIRLFVIRRIITNSFHTPNSNDDAKNTESKQHESKPDLIKTTAIEDLISVFSNDSKLQAEAYNILTRLINDGIRRYMNKWYIEKTQAIVIEKIFNKIILKKFGKEYNQLMTFQHVSNCKNENMHSTKCKYQCMVFKINDLVSQIFQYLQWGKYFNDDLFSCSLVNSCWLYHSWNVNSIYHIDLSKLFGRTILIEQRNVENKEKSTVTRMWQRLIRVKSVRVSYHDEAESEDKLLVTKLFGLTSIKNIRITTNDNQVSKVQALISRSKDQIKHCDIRMKKSLADSKNMLPPLGLPNAEYVSIGDLYFYRIWSNKCKELQLIHVKYISQHWCKFVMQHCDFSNINNLTLQQVSFDYESTNGSLLKHLASKFISLKQLNIYFYGIGNESVISFWQLLKPIILKNKVMVQLNIHDMKIVNDYSDYDLDSLNKILKQEDLKINKLIVRPGLCGHRMINDSELKFIKQRDDCGLNHLVIKHGKSDKQDIFTTKIIHQLLASFKSVNTVEVDGYGLRLSDITDFTGLNSIIEKRLFIIAYFSVDYLLQNKEIFLSLFKQLCQRILHLFVKQIAFDIKISFYQVREKKIFSKCLSILESYFENNKFEVEYNKPKAKNHMCVPRIRPYTCLMLDSGIKSDSKFMFRATNVQF